MLEQHLWPMNPLKVRGRGCDMWRSCWVNSRVVGPGGRTWSFNVQPFSNLGYIEQIQEFCWLRLLCDKFINEHSLRHHEFYLWGVFFWGVNLWLIKISIWFWFWEGSYPRWWPRGIFGWTTAKDAQGCADVIMGGCLISILVLRLLRDCNSYLFNPGCLGLWCFWKLQCYNSCLYNSTKTSGNTKTFGEKLHLWSRCI